MLSPVYLLLVPTIVSAVALAPRYAGPRALYFLDSNPAGSNIVAMDINLDDGTLSDQTLTATEQKVGIGLNGLDPSGTPSFSGSDPLFAQHALIVDGTYIFNVNANNNSVSMFVIDPLHPTCPTLINSAPSLGTFPNSVAYSAVLKTACVVNTGTVPGVACFSVDHAKGLTPITPLMPIALNQTMPPVGPVNTASDIQFSPSGKYLWLAVKGPNPTTPGKNYIYPVIKGKVSSTPIVSSIPVLTLSFGFSFISETKAVITDAVGAYDMVSIDPKTYVVSLDARIAPVGAQAICWSAYSARFNTVFIADALNNNITLADPVTGAVKGTLIQKEAKVGGGAFDMVIDRHYLYSLQGLSSIGVSDLTGLNSKKLVGPDSLVSQQVQSFALSGTRLNFAGLAVYPSA